ncbi:hypothetical protein [Desulfonatronovibrio magnus]|nr:hypothetical protein [Desulfonatronovibrio magnus]
MPLPGHEAECRTAGADSFSEGRSPAEQYPVENNMKVFLTLKEQ